MEQTAAHAAQASAAGFADAGAGLATPIAGVELHAGRMSAHAEDSAPLPGAEAERSGTTWTLESYESKTPNQLEVGIAGGTWGWLKVRAELRPAGEVAAVLRGGTAEAEAALRAHTTGLRSYLDSQQIPVAQVLVEASRSTTGFDTAAGSPGNGRSGEQTPQRQATAEDGSPAARRGQTAVATSGDGALPTAMLPLAHGGGWLSVMA